MRGTRIILGRMEVSKGWRIGLFALMGVMAAAALGILLGGPFVAPRRVAHAAPDIEIDPWPALEIACLETLVEEGEEFRLEVRATHAPEWLYPRMRVFWYTEALTADESDYRHLQEVQQESTWDEADLGAMGHDFRTLEDNYPEIDETFRVRFENDNEHGTDGHCTITIADDDGVGIYDMEITSEPGEVTTESEDVVSAYSAGDIIEITAHFTGTVTTLNPDTGESADYAGLYIQVGENRRLAKLLRGDGTDTLVFGYTVQAEDEDANGISVEAGRNSSTGFCFNDGTGDIGLWPASPASDGMNRIYLGLGDDRDHKVVVVPAKDTDDDNNEVTPPEPPDATIIPPDPEPDPWVALSTHIESSMLAATSGELTEEDNGRDWFSFEAEGGESYIIELRNGMEFAPDASAQFGIDMKYVDGDLVDPSILEVVNEDGEQVLGEHDWGGFMGFFARAFFTPDEDGTYYVAVGAGRQDREGLGHYDFSVRQDDHADDLRTVSGFVLRPGESVTARIDSDVAKDDPGVEFWHWIKNEDGTALPMWGLEGPDDRDAFPFEISEEGTYELKVTDGPEGVGIWWTVDGSGTAYNISRTTPVESLVDEYRPGTYYVDVGTPYDSSGNTGTYTLMLTRE